MSAAVVASAPASSSSTVQQHMSSSSSREDSKHSITSNGKTPLKGENDTQESKKPATNGTAHAREESRSSDPHNEATPKQGKSDTPLPSDLRSILTEVARTGTCSWLSWSHTGDGDCGHETPPKVAGAFSGLGPNKRIRTLASASANSSSKTAVTAAAANPQRQQSQHSLYRRPKPRYATAFSATAQSRKKHRNGIHVRRRLGDGAGSKATAAGRRKRPLSVIRTSSSASTTSSIFSPGSVGSGRTSGSEPEDTSQYECDSEGTSATTNSEISFDKRDQLRKRVALQTSKLTAATPVDEKPSSQYKSLKEAVCTALALVLDHWYNNKGGYTLSPAEKRRNDSLTEQPIGDSTKGGDSSKDEMMNCPQRPSTDAKAPSISAEIIFKQRRERLLNMLGKNAEASEDSKQASSHKLANDGPPFTIQRIAEVLVAPERYYTRTHKLCNCLEKLLLVTSSVGAFGGSTGGNTSQSRREEMELAALADERGRLHTEFRRRLRRKNSSSSDDVVESGEGATGSRPAASGPDTKKEASPEKSNENVGGSAESPAVASSDATSREIIEAAARASLRTKFDHVGIDPHSSAVASRDVRSIAENRGMTNSPPPPSLAMASAATAGLALPGHGGLLRQHHSDQDHPPGLARVPSPILFQGGEGSSAPPMAPMHANPNMLHLQMNHAASLVGVSPLDLMGLNVSESGSPPSAPSGITSSLLKDADVESRSSASSDVDSESDDVSLDDSASDRSDGSDYEPFSAARAMALNRMQQQQRQLQSRMLTSLGSHHQQNEGSRPPAECEYQSGDSIDSTRAEDSGGSDSSSSDLAD